MNITSLVADSGNHTDTNDNDFSGFEQFVLDVGGIPYIFSLFCIIFIFVFVICLRCVFCCDRVKPFDFIFHRKIWMKPFQTKYLREYVQYYLLDITYGELVLYFFYFVNIFVWFLFPCKKCFDIMDFKDYYSYSNGFGRLALFNMILMLFPAHRFSIVQMMFGHGVERLIKFHKMFGLLVYIFVLIHFVMVLFDVIWQHQIEYMFFWNTGVFINQPLPGLLSGFFMFFLAIFTLDCCRRSRYCLFWYFHMIFAFFMILFLVFHRTWATFGLLSIGIFFTLVDFLYRFCILLVPVQVESAKYFGQSGIAKIILNRIGLGVFSSIQPGQVVYLWTSLNPLDPGHPFTVASTFDTSISVEKCCSDDSFDPKKGTSKCLSLYVTKRGSFTKKLLAKIEDANSKNLPFSSLLRFDGPYGEGGEYNKYDQIVFCSYGAFVAPVFGIIKILILKSIERRMKKSKNQRKRVKKGPNRKKKMKLIWQITKIEYFELFDEEISFILKHVEEIDLEIKVFFKGNKTDIKDIMPENPSSYLAERPKIIDNPMSPIPGSTYFDEHENQLSISEGRKDVVAIEISNSASPPTSVSPLLRSSSGADVNRFSSGSKSDSEDDVEEIGNNEYHELVNISDFVHEGKIDWENELKVFGKSTIKTYVYLQGVHFFTSAIKKAVSNVGWSRVFHYEEPEFSF